MRASGGLPSAFSCFSRQRVWAFAWLVGSALAGGSLPACTLITDVDRQDIPEPPTPTFPEIDAGPLPSEPVLDASVPDAADAAPPATDAGADGGDAGTTDAAAPSGDAG
jgi:hypothetical protein